MFWCIPQGSNPDLLGFNQARRPTTPEMHGAVEGLRTLISFLTRERLYQLSYQQQLYFGGWRRIRTHTPPSEGLRFSRPLPLPRFYRLSHPILVPLVGIEPTPLCRDRNLNPARLPFHHRGYVLVPVEGLEPPLPKELVSKTSASTIPPHGL